MSLWLFGAAALASVAATIAGARHLPVYAWLKPWPLILMLLYFLSASTLNLSALAFVAGVLYLVFSGLGDVALLFKRKGFLLGLAAFLIAHWLLIAHLILLIKFSGLSVLLTVIMAAVASLWLVRWLKPGQFVLRVGVWAYGMTLLILLAVSIVVAIDGPSLWRWSIVLAPLFILSDLLLAMNRFKAPFASAQAWILSTYFASQLGWTWIWAQQQLS